MNIRIFLKPSEKEILSYPRIISGHQPIIFYYGVLLKALMLNKFSNEKLFLIADHDERSEIFAYIPTNNFQIKKINFIKLEGNYIFEYFPKISSEIVFSFYSQIRNEVHKSLIQNVEEAFEVAFKVIKEVDNYVDFIYKWTFDYSDINIKTLRVSELSKTQEFKEFVIEIANSDFHKKFNHIISKLKRKPFRLLEKDELPFWKIVNSRRLPLLREDLKNLERIEVRPRAYTLTLFFRKRGYAFLHGFGGYGYDKIIEKMYDNLGPRFMVSGDKFLSLNTGIDDFDEFYKLKHFIADIKWHPEYFFRCYCPLKEVRDFFYFDFEVPYDELKMKKFLKIIENPKDYKFFKELNENLLNKLKHLDSFKKILEIYEKTKICVFREYPFFLYGRN